MLRFRCSEGLRSSATFAFCLLLFSGSNGFSNPAGADQPAAIEVTALGDSVTNGFLPGGGFGYATLLAFQLAGSHEIDNIGCPGTTSTDWTLSQGGHLCGMERLDELIFLEKAVPSLPADFVTIMLGTNDALGFFEPEPVSAELYRANLEEMIDNLLLEGARTVVLLSPPPQCGAAEQALLEAYREAGIGICLNDPDVLCGVDVLNLLDANDFVGCDVHPNARGHAKIAAQLRQRLLTHTPISPEVEVFQWIPPELTGASGPIFPVAVLSDASFDAPSTLDPKTFSFGASGWEDSLVMASGSPLCMPLDVNEDGLPDAACAFWVLDSGLDLGSTEAFLRGRTLRGTAVDSRVTGSAAELQPLPAALLEAIEAGL